MSDTLRVVSRKEWEGRGCGTIENVNAGSIQRIADACEKMAANWTQLTVDRDRYRKWYELEKEHSKRLAASINALRGAVTKAKRGKATQ